MGWVESVIPAGRKRYSGRIDNQDTPCIDNSFKMCIKKKTSDTLGRDARVISELECTFSPV